MELTFSILDALDVRTQLVDRLHPLLLLLTVKHDPTSRLQVRDACLERHRADRDAGVHRVGREIEPSYRSGVGSSALLLEVGDELDCSDLGRSRDSSSGEDGSECVESIVPNEFSLSFYQWRGDRRRTESDLVVRVQKLEKLNA